MLDGAHREGPVVPWFKWIEGRHHSVYECVCRGYEAIMTARTGVCAGDIKQSLTIMTACMSVCAGERPGKFIRVNSMSVCAGERPVRTSPPGLGVGPPGALVSQGWWGGGGGGGFGWVGGERGGGGRGARGAAVREGRGPCAAPTAG